MQYLLAPHVLFPHAHPLRVLRYDLDVHHRAGMSHGNADTLSRNPCASCQHQEQLNETANEESIKCTESNNLVIRVTTRRQAQENDSTESAFRPNQGWLQGWGIDKIHLSQMKDTAIGPLLLAKEEGHAKPIRSNISDKCGDYKALWAQWDHLEIRGNLLFRKSETGRSNFTHWQRLVPKVPKMERSFPTSTWPQDWMPFGNQEDIGENSICFLLALYPRSCGEFLQNMQWLC